METKRCTHCGREDLSVSLHELSLIPGLDEAEAKEAFKNGRTKVRRKLCSQCYEQAMKTVTYHR